jgi:iron(III) transport system substrate-binding protein
MAKKQGNFFAASLSLFLLGFVGDLRGQSDWKREWEKTLQGAKREGQVVIYDNVSNDRVYQEFQKKYPDLKLVTIIARGDQLGPRIMAERRAEKHLADVYLGGPTTSYVLLYLGKALDPIRPILILPEVVDESKWFEGRHHYVDPEGQYIFLFEGTAIPYIHYNTAFVKRDEISSYWELLSPKWKGRMVSFDPMVAGIVSHGIRFMYHNAELGPKFLTRLFSEMDLTILRDARQMVNGLAQSKFSLCLFCYDIEEAKRQGLPVETIGPYSLKEGASVVPIIGSTALMNRAPHPNAAKIFMNWFLSREGQMAYQKSRLAALSGGDSLRIDIPKDDVPPESRRRTRGKYLMLNRPEWFDVRPIRDLIREAQARVK